MYNSQYFRAILSHLSHKREAALHNIVEWTKRKHIYVQLTL